MNSHTFDPELLPARNANGQTTHPHLAHYIDRETGMVRYGALHAAGYRLEYVVLEDVNRDLFERYYSTGQMVSLSEWLPPPPDAGDWLLVAVEDSDDVGPVAAFVQELR